MKVIIARNKKEAAKKASLAVLEIIKKKPNAILGLATGSTMVPLYKELVKLFKKGMIDFSKVRTFNLDEYAGLDNSNKNSYHSYMNSNFFSKVNVKKENIHFPSANGKSYELKIKKLGGLDLCFLGIGRNGHIAFNEPGSSFSSTTRKIKLTENTIEANSRFFRKKSHVPRFAYTMGIKTIMNSKKLVLLAFGKEKSNAIRKAAKEKPTTKIPASILQQHKGATVIADRKAAAGLQ